MFASELCRSAAEEDEMDAEDLQNELAPIQVQLGFVKQQLGKPDEAVEIYNSVLKTKYLLIFIIIICCCCESSPHQHVLILEGPVMKLSVQLLPTTW